MPGVEDSSLVEKLTDVLGLVGCFDTVRHSDMFFRVLFQPQHFLVLLFSKECSSFVGWIEPELGFENGWIQGIESVRNYLPDFINRRHPFE